MYMIITQCVYGLALRQKVKILTHSYVIKNLRRKKKSFFILYAFISVKILYFEDDIFLSLCLEIIANLARKINDTRQRGCSYLGNKCLIKDSEI